jgi:uncharacterized protein (TIGR00369 family)
MSENADLTAQILAQMRAQLPEGAAVQIPPNVFVEMGAAFVAYDPGQALTVRLPVKPAYLNPLGAMQGGMLVAAIDNAIGPLSFLVAPPSVTTQLNTTYVRPITPADDYLEVEARLIERTRRQVFLAATVRNPAGETVALAQATCVLTLTSNS